MSCSISTKLKPLNNRNHWQFITIYERLEIYLCPTGNFGVPRVYGAQCKYLAMQLLRGALEREFLRHSRHSRFPFRWECGGSDTWSGSDGATADILFRFPRMVESKAASYRENVGVVAPTSCLAPLRHILNDFGIFARESKRDVCFHLLKFLLKTNRMRPGD